MQQYNTKQQKCNKCNNIYDATTQYHIFTAPFEYEDIDEDHNGRTGYVKLHVQTFELHQMHEISWGDIDHVFLFGPKQRKTILAILIKTYSLSM